MPLPDQGSPAPRYSRPIPPSRLPGAERFPDPAHTARAAAQLRRFRVGVVGYVLAAAGASPIIWAIIAR